LENLGFGVDSVEGTDNQPSILFYYPIAQGNPYQAMYYSEFLVNGVVPIGINKIENITSFRLPVNSFLHLHWLGGIIGDAENEKIANERVEEFISRIIGIKSNGVKIVWTVHNILPHDSTLKEAQIHLRKELIKLADIIHIMNEETKRLSEPFFEIPDEKIIFSPHPSYRGYYPSIVTREESRFQLKIPQDHVVYLFFGSIQAYKGLEDLITAFEELEKKNPNIYLLIAGKVVNKSYFSQIKNKIQSNMKIKLIESRIPTEHVQYYFRASDYCICPYRVTLNSGVAHLSHAFDIPVIGPNVGGFKLLLEKGGGFLFDNEDIDDLYSTLARSLDETILVKDIQALDSKFEMKTISTSFCSKLIEFPM
jgi:glycosyltransferase involved in cell wall biosynthesis